MEGEAAAVRRLSAAVLVLVAAGYAACLAGVLLCPAIVPEPATWLDASTISGDPRLGAMAANGLYWLVVLVAAALMIAGITLAGRAALRQLADGERVAEGRFRPAPDARGHS
ncbi:hypothetical protein P5G50_10785 [Leifsonia sp. F6_8S_P_1B]|uniref:Uncharacterized protein n=1 Tax=Leifsonia williamsii TaxID=3035919 RepID=A0ABT8KBW7_9MICO|nr:hypothetical protein [Leifsonia williamsii]MDN4614936.1 hypothetical protein [Leifsonia williamsii]